jgi:hypothetical protein
MQRNLEGAVKPPQLEYVTTCAHADGQEQITRSIYNPQTQPLPWPFRELGNLIAQASAVDLKIFIDGATYRLRSRRAHRRTLPLTSPPQRLLSSEELDLFDQLRRVHKQLADEQGHIAAFMVFSDACLQAMATYRPVCRERFARLPGVGPHKLEEYFQPFSEVIARYATEHRLTTDLDPEETPPGDAREKDHPRATYPTPTQQRTLMLYRAGLSVQEIAEQR